MDTSVSNMVRQISDALYKDSRTHKEVIEVGYYQGVVTLTGNVKNAGVVQAAEEIARSQPGVISVVNELKAG